MNKKFQTNFDIVPLYGENNLLPQVIKVGILPFIREKNTPDSMKILVMKPSSENELLGVPKFQIAKGTRRINMCGSWCDMREDDLRYADESFHEPLIATALREGSEEIGLKPKNIRILFDMGGFTFISASKGTKKQMHLFVADIIDAKNFGRFESTTSETHWFTPKDFMTEGRPDHAAIIGEVVARLNAYSSA